MNRALVDKLARALLYEGYILYPYRPSVKNRQRWSFGGLYPKGWSDAQEGTDAWTMQTQCLAVCGAGAVLQASVRFLHLIDRTVGELIHPAPDLPGSGEPEHRLVQMLDVGDKRYQPWQEAAERQIDLGEFDVDPLIAKPHHIPFEFPHRREVEALRAPGGNIVGALIREQQAVDGTVELSATTLADDLCRISLKILNRTALSNPAAATRDEALMRAMVSTHTILGIRKGEFISLTDPPDKWREQASRCANIGAWPVMVGENAERDTILSSPIILSDYPQIAPESPGDLFDSTEIDEILTLRIMTLTDEEKRTAASVDERVRELLARTESLAREQLAGLHGTIRGLQPVTQEQRND